MVARVGRGDETRGSAGEFLWGCVKVEGWRVEGEAAAVATWSDAANAPWRGGVETLKS